MNVRRTVYTILKHLICIALCLAVVMPFYMVIINSLKSKSEAARMSLSLPTVWHFGNYIEVINRGKLMLGFSNSVLYALVSTSVAVFACAMAAFIISRKKTKLNNFLYYFILCGLFLPVNYVTLSMVLNSLNIANTRYGLILVFSSSMIPFCVFTIRNFMSSVPVEMDEAAVIDGAGPLNLFFRIIVPMLRPVLVTAFLLQFMGVWSDFMTPLYLTSSSKLWPMNMAVYTFFGKNQQYWNYVFADIVLTCLPVILLYLLGQKYIVSGMTSGAVKE